MFRLLRKRNPYKRSSSLHNRYGRIYQSFFREDPNKKAYRVPWKLSIAAMMYTSSNSCNEKLRDLQCNHQLDKVGKLRRFVAYYTAHLVNAEDGTVKHEFNGVAGQLIYKTKTNTTVSISYKRLPSRIFDKFLATVSISSLHANVSIDVLYSMPTLWSYNLLLSLVDVRQSVISVIRDKKFSYAASLGQSDKLILEAMLKDFDITPSLGSFIGAVFQIKRLSDVDLLDVAAMGTKQGVSGNRPIFIGNEDIDDRTTDLHWAYSQLTSS